MELIEDGAYIILVMIILFLVWERIVICLNIKIVEIEMKLIHWLEEHSRVTWGITLTYMLIIFLISSIPYPQQPLPLESYAPVIEHILEYAILGFLLSVAIKTENKKMLKWTIFWAILIATIYGITDEIHQLFVPGRTASVFDAFLDCIGAIIGSFFRFLLR